MLSRLRRASAGLAFALMLAPAQALPVAQVLDFDDLPNSPGGTRMADGYGGFDWGDQWFQMSPTSGDLSSNFLATSTSGGTLIRRSDGGAFFFDGADFWSRRGANAVGDFFFVLYGSNGATLYNGADDGKAGRMRFNATHQLLVANYSGPIHAMAFGFDNDDYDHLAMDNLRVRVEPLASAVPEAPTAVLALLGLAVLRLGRRR